jgi:hypothetical protein
MKTQRYSSFNTIISGEGIKIFLECEKLLRGPAATGGGLRHIMTRGSIFFCKNAS